ncbi:MAG: glycosyltransferase family 2 protein [Acidobacteriota bacterium]
MSPPTRTVAVIPAYQAADTVGPVVAVARRVVSRVVVVDDGSRDDTGAVARDAGAQVLRCEENGGKGAALRRAFDLLLSESVEEIVTVDADGQHAPTEIPKLVAARRRSGAHLILGTRTHLYAEMSRPRRLANTLSSRAISATFARVMLDVQTGFRLYTAELLRSTGFPEPRFGAESAVVVRALRCGLRIESVPIDLAEADGRRTSHYRPVVDSLRIFRATARARFEPRSAFVGCGGPPRVDERTPRQRRHHELPHDLRS